MPVYRPCLRVLLLTGLLAAGAGGKLVHGQILHASGDRPAFEVATIKPWKRTPSPPPMDGTTPVKIMKASPVGGGGQPTNRVHMILPAALLIASAYNLPAGSENRILQGPNWQGPNWLRQDIDQYEIQAKIEDFLFAAMQKMTPAQQREQVALMEQSLLADRFKLKVHFETREMPVYSLIVVKSGAKLTPAKDGESIRLSTVSNGQGREMTAIAVTLDQFVLSPLLTGPADGRLVVNKTGLKGSYDFTLKWESEQFAASDAVKNLGAEAPPFLTAIQEQLGLKLVPSKALVEVIVVDHIEPPSTN
jgi:bla regulator protein blaR1